jgi:hypothetical protein
VFAAKTHKCDGSGSLEILAVNSPIVLDLIRTGLTQLVNDMRSGCDHRHQRRGIAPSRLGLSRLGRPLTPPDILGKALLS